jgi:hypothetical protein
MAVGHFRSVIPVLVTGIHASDEAAALVFGGYSPNLLCVAPSRPGSRTSRYARFRDDEGGEASAKSPMAAGGNAITAVVMPGAEGWPASIP